MANPVAWRKDEAPLSAWRSSAWGPALPSAGKGRDPWPAGAAEPRDFEEETGGHGVTLQLLRYKKSAPKGGEPPKAMRYKGKVESGEPEEPAARRAAWRCLMANAANRGKAPDPGRAPGRTMAGKCHRTAGIRCGPGSTV